MTNKDTAEIEETEADLDVEVAEDDWDDDAVAELGDDADEGDEGDDDAALSADEDDDDEAVDGATGGDEALDELEAEELDMLTDDEESETLIVDEAAELRAIRRAEIAMERGDVGGQGTDEFVCQSCFLVLKTSQLANKRKMYCKDCAV